jgi:F-type H+-transporting ATPase subunit epsilon
MDNEAPGVDLQLIVVTPERTVLDEKAEFVALPMYDGELGVLSGRAPLIGRLGTGELRLSHGATTHRYFIDGGFAQVRANVVTVLTSKAIKAEEIDTAAAQAQIDAAQQPGTTPEARTAQQEAAAKARVQLRVAAKLSGPSLAVPEVPQPSHS